MEGMVDLCGIFAARFTSITRSRRPPEVASRLAAIVLAAGGSTRFGKPKQLLTIHGENIVARAVRSALEAGIDNVLVVLGAFAPSVAMFIPPSANVEMVVNDNWSAGQSSSLKLGLERAVESNVEGVLIMLADQPSVESESLRRLIRAFDSSHRIVASKYDGAIGVPAVFGTEFLSELLALEGDRGAGAWIRSRLNQVTTTSMPEAAIDIDVPEDFEKLTRSSTAE